MRLFSFFVKLALNLYFYIKLIFCFHVTVEQMCRKHNTVGKRDHQSGWLCTTLKTCGQNDCTDNYATD